VRTRPVGVGWSGDPESCAWVWVWEDVTLVCTEVCVPGCRLCADHLVASLVEGAE
jgi:hypothetical protein